VILLGVFDPQ